MLDSSLHAQKFLFLAALVSIIIFAKQDFFASSFSKDSSQANAGVVAQEVPLLILRPPEFPSASGTSGGLKMPMPASVLPKEAAGVRGREILTRFSDFKNFYFHKVGDGRAPRLGAKAAIVADLLSGQDFLALQPEKRWPIASITKLASAVVALRGISMHEEITLAADDFSPEAAGNGFEAGETYTARDLVRAMLLKSSNAAAEALARTGISGQMLAGLAQQRVEYGVSGRSGFILAMNKLVLEWGLRDAYFDDPTGLSAANQSTAESLVGLAKHIYEEHPEVFEITRRESARITELKTLKTSTLMNINLFPGWPEFIGGKTGFTDEAGGNLLTVFKYENRPIVIIVLGSNDRFHETELLWNWLKDNYKISF